MKIMKSLPGRGQFLIGAFMTSALGLAHKRVNKGNYKGKGRLIWEK